MNAITLTDDQQAGFDAFTTFIMDPSKSVFVLAGYSGTGKSTLVRTLLTQLDNLIKTIRLVNPKQPQYSVLLTATTNKAAETLSRVVGEPVSTIHSALGLRVQTDYSTRQTRLVPKRGHECPTNSILFIDEASYIDRDLLQHIFKRTTQCKIVFIGDPAQLTPVKYTDTPVFKAGFEGVELTKVVRHDGPILELATLFRHAVNTGEFFSFKPDGKHIQYLEREAFDKAILEEFSRPDWHFHDSKVLAWTNSCVVQYNKGIREQIQGNPELQVGDYAICNKYINQGNISFKTDQLVMITSISEPCQEQGLMGRRYGIDGVATLFMPDSLQEKNRLIKEATSNEDLFLCHHIDTNWIDLRAAYACTVNKSQGSTFRKVFIDLDDIKRCTHGNQMARLMYVAVSRASHQLILTGDLI